MYFFFLGKGQVVISLSLSPSLLSSSSHMQCVIPCPEEISRNTHTHFPPHPRQLQRADQEGRREMGIRAVWVFFFSSSAGAEKILLPPFFLLGLPVLSEDR